MKLRTLLPVSLLLVWWMSLADGRADALDNWTTTQVSTNSFQLNHVVYGNGRFVAAGGWLDGGALLSSEDGLSWTLRADGGGTGSPSLVWGLTYGGGRFVAVGHFGGTASSTNGINWAFGSRPTQGFYGVAYGAGRYVAVGYPVVTSTSTNSVFYSDDGVNWQTPFLSPQEHREVWSVAYGAGKFVAIAAGGYSYSSANGLVWTKASFPSGPRKIVYLNNRFFVPYGDGTNLISSDGVNWAVLPTGVAGRFGRIGYANGVYLGFTGAAAPFGPYTNVVCSTDGTNWVQRTTVPLTQGATIEDSSLDVASDGTRYVAVGGIRLSGGAYNNAFVFASEALAGITITNNPPPQLIVSGVVGLTYRIEYVPIMPPSVSNQWQTLTNFVLPSSPFVLSDPDAASASQRFYRAVLLP